MVGQNQIIDLEIPLVRKGLHMRYKTELLIGTLEELGFLLNKIPHNLYHGLSSIHTFNEILESNALMGPNLVAEYKASKHKGKDYQLPENMELILGNPPDDGKYVGFADIEYASHVATLGKPLDHSFNNKEPIILGFKYNTIWPIISLNYLKLDDPELGLGVVIAPKRIKSDIESKIDETCQQPHFFRIYASFQSLT